MKLPTHFGPFQLHRAVCLLVPLGFLALAGCRREPPPDNVDEFLKAYNEIDQRLYTVSRNAEWRAATNLTDQNTGERMGAELAHAAFHGSQWVIGNSRRLLDLKTGVTDLQFRQLDKILLDAAEYPGTAPGIVRARVEAEARWTTALNSFNFCLEQKGDRCAKTVDSNAIDDVLLHSKSLKERRRYWEISRQPGVVLKPGLVELRDLRNRAAQALGYTSYFHLQVADYGMSIKEMLLLTERMVRDTEPLYDQLHLWARRKLAERYGESVPTQIPAHWLGDRWGQAWPGLTDAADLDAAFRSKPADWIVKQAERLYASMGMPELPASFWEKSDLYPLQQASPRKKSERSGAWHIDRDRDVRCLMNVVPSFHWFQLAHHELGHVYYELAYSNPNVPMVLRSGANRAFSEAIGDLIAAAAQRDPYLRQIGVLPADRKTDRTQELLAEALDGGIVFIPWSAGVVTRFEHELYEEKLPPEKFNQRWWELVHQYQRISPPAPRGDELCDGCAKTHVIDDPAQYYDYALAVLIRYQLHDYIARKILKQDPWSCSYYGNKEVGRWLWDLMSLGATRDWRQVLKEKTGEDLSSRAMLEYYRPLAEYLAKENPRDASAPGR